MRIYFVGSHATGKTTLCRYVSRRYDLPMISEVARAVLAEMETGFDALRTDMDLVAEYQERVFARQIAVEHSHNGHFVSDRAFDNLAYVAEHTTNAAQMMNDQRFHDYMKWVREGIVFFLRPHQSLLKDDGVRAGVSWDSVLRIDGMVKLMLEQHQISYLPLESVSMQERVRAVEFVLSRSGLVSQDRREPRRARSQTVPPLPLAHAAPAVARPTQAQPSPVTAAAAVATLDSWPYGLVGNGDHEA
ncbi:MAG: AAA family ATPase [Proteobacteria bacterium]|nr:AAA family ATPase [Pseudomonadota bacterium]